MLFVIFLLWEKANLPFQSISLATRWAALDPITSTAVWLQHQSSWSEPEPSVCTAATTPADLLGDEPGYVITQKLYLYAVVGPSLWFRPEHLNNYLMDDYDIIIHGAQMMNPTQFRRSWLFLSRHQEVDACGFQCKISKADLLLVSGSCNFSSCAIIKSV